MPVNISLAQLSDHFLMVTVFLYALAMLAFASDFAFGRRAAEPATAEGAAPTQASAQASAAQAELADSAEGEQTARVAVTAGVAAGGVAAGAPASGAGAAPGTPAHAGTLPAAPVAAGGTGSGQAAGAHAGPGPWIRAAVTLTVIGLATHLLGILTRGMAEHRIPWGNMYEFITAITCAVVIAFLVVLARYRTWSIGLFVMFPVVLGLGLCATVLYTAAGPLVPALHSYWIAIHVTAAILATGSFVVAAVMTGLYLLTGWHAARPGEHTSGLGAILRRLPSAQTLDRLSYRTIVFAFPIWTFAIIAGAIWADQAWGRYWGWDPKETWAFITWVVYAGYLHSRATVGWRGRRSAYIQLLGFACLIFNLVGVNLWITGLHSYAGIG